jgi:hypothetical protein
MKGVLPLLLLLTMQLSGCGGSSATSSSFCQSIDAVKTDVNTLKGLKANPSISLLTTDIQNIASDIDKAVAEAKSSVSPQVNALKSSLKQLKSTFTQVKDRTLTVAEALPKIKSETVAVSDNWQALTKAMKC